MPTSEIIDERTIERVAIFSRKPPATEFGYQPPREARAVRWVCSNGDCRHGDVGPFDRWPRACPACRSAIWTLQLEEPWNHEAKRVEIDTRLRSPRWDGDQAAAQADDLCWHFADALRKGGTPDAALYMQKAVLSDGPLGLGAVCWSFVDAALSASREDLAADVLERWFRVTDFTDLATDNGRRTNARQLATCYGTFLDSDVRWASGFRAVAVQRFFEVITALGDEASGNNMHLCARVRARQNGKLAELDRVTRSLEELRRGGTTAGSLPGQLAQRMALRGWYELQPPNCGVDSSLVWEVTGAPFVEIAMSRPQTFIDGLERAVRSGDMLTLTGAVRCISDLLGEQVRTNPVAVGLLDRSLRLRREAGISSLFLNGYERSRWDESSGGSAWPV